MTRKREVIVDRQGNEVSIWDVCSCPGRKPGIRYVCEPCLRREHSAGNIEIREAPEPI